MRSLFLLRLPFLYVFFFFVHIFRRLRQEHYGKNSRRKETCASPGLPLKAQEKKQTNKKANEMIRHAVQKTSAAAARGFRANLLAFEVQRKLVIWTALVTNTLE